MKTTKTSIGRPTDHNQNVLRTCPGRGENVLRDRTKTSPRRCKNVSRTKQKRLQSEPFVVLKSSSRRLQDVGKTKPTPWLLHIDLPRATPSPTLLLWLLCLDTGFYPHHFPKSIHSKSWFLLFNKIQKHSRSIYKISVPWDQYLFHNIELNMTFHTGQLSPS